MVNLDPVEMLARGGQRMIFSHPDDATKILKVLHFKPRPATQYVNRFLERVFPLLRFRGVHKEYQEYLRVMLHNPQPDFHPPMAHLLGFAQTNLGLACISEKICDVTGALGETLGGKCSNGRLTAGELDQFNDVIARMYRHNLRAGDLHEGNFVFGRRSGGIAANECVFVDGLGDLRAVPLRSWARGINRMEMDKSFGKLAKKIGLEWKKAERQMAYSQ